MRKTSVALVLLLTLGGTATAATSPSLAHAASVDVACIGSEAAAYQPGVLLTPQTVKVSVTGLLSPCTSAVPAITAGTYTDNPTTTLSCDTLLAGRTGSRVLHWSNGQSSTFTYNRAINNAGGQTTVTFTGPITSGEFAGDTAVEQVVFVTLNTLQCLAPPGITSLGPGPAVLTITAP